MPAPLRACRYRLAATLGTAALATLGVAQTPPSFPREARAIWVTTVGNIDWPSRRDLTTAQQQAEAIAILNRAVALNANMVFFMVRPMADAVYPSALEPWSPYLTGTMGKAPSPAYDPLKFWIDEAHARGLELHAWFNPYRAVSSTSMATTANHVSQTNPEYVRTYGSVKWLDPGERWVQNRSTSVIVDVLSRYDVDGIHFDDYFYPYPVSGVAFPDSATYAAYQAGGGTMSLGDWRRDNVNKFIVQVNKAIKVRKPWVKFGISPFGIWRPGNPSGITGLDAYASIYADSRKWLREGMVDYLSPQLYWQIDDTGQSFPRLLDWWISQNVMGRHLWPGIITSNIGTQFENWPMQEILDQIDITRSRSGSTGVVHFSMRALTGNYKGIADALATTRYNVPALVPATPWLDSVAPAAPIVTSATTSGSFTQITWENRSAEPIRRYAVRAQYGTAWSFGVIAAPTTTVLLPSSNSAGTLNSVLITAVDRSSNESPAAVWTPPLRNQIIQKANGKVRPGRLEGSGR